MMISPHLFLQYQCHFLGIEKLSLHSLVPLPPRSSLFPPTCSKQFGYIGSDSPIVCHSTTSVRELQTSLRRCHSYNQTEVTSQKTTSKMICNAQLTAYHQTSSCGGSDLWQVKLTIVAPGRRQLQQNVLCRTEDEQKIISFVLGLSRYKMVRKLCVLLQLRNISTNVYIILDSRTCMVILQCAE